MFCGGKEWIDILVQVAFSQEIRISAKKKKKKKRRTSKSKYYFLYM